LDDEILEDFRREVDIMLNLHHPNILLFMGACTKPGNLMIVTELMPKGSVEDLIHDSKAPLSFQQRMMFAKETALGMNWLHQLKPIFLHLDLKPANLLVDHNWTVKIADFGMSQVKGAGSGGPVGSPFYMAPEILLEKGYDEKADVYSFAIVLWEIFTQEEPYNGEFQSFEELIEGVGLENKRPKIPSDVTYLLRDTIVSCWDKEPTKRPSFEDLLRKSTFDHIILDYAILDKPGKEFWKSKFLEKDKITFEHFIEAFKDHFKLKPEDLKDNIQLTYFKVIMAPDGKHVTLVSFANALEWFGPLLGMNVVEKIQYLLNQKWFHGDISQSEAELLLSSQKRGKIIQKTTGFWLVRFGDGHGEYFISVVAEKNKVEHFKITHRTGTLMFNGQHHSSWEDLFTKRKKELNFSRDAICLGSKYELINKSSTGSGKSL